MSMAASRSPVYSPLERAGAMQSSSTHEESASPWLQSEAAVVSLCGARHAVNEDSHSRLDAWSRLFVVADGVGGGAMASRASRELVSHLHAALAEGTIDPDALREALLDSDRAVARSIASQTAAPGAATVAVCASLDASLSRWLVGWVGDCRAYRLSAEPDEPAQLLTLDDTYRHLGEEPPPGGSPDDPARMVGNGAVGEPNVCEIELAGGEMLLLCSDGVHKYADPGDIARLLRGAEPLVQGCARLVEFARAGGSDDDATALVVQRARADGRTQR